MSNASRVSVVVCSKNSSKMLRPCLDSILDNQPGEIIFIDGNSTDNSLAIVASYDNIKIYSDQGLGLSSARKLGVYHAKKDYILFIGPDNILESSFIENLVVQINKSPYDAVTVQTRIQNPQSFWDFGADLKWKYLMDKPGDRKVIGTPTLYSKRFLEIVNYSSEDLGPCDDTDIGYRAEKAGLRLGLVGQTIYEQNGFDFTSTFKRYKWYGSGDYYFYKKYCSTWSFSRRIQSISHPLRQCLKYSALAIKDGKSLYILWFIITAASRYYGWISTLLRGTKS